MSSRQSVSGANRLILLGPPGAGKGTQAKTLAGRLDVPHVASGDLFRHHQQQGTPLGVKALDYMTQGMLVPDEITIAMVLERILPPLAQNGFLLDGFPRNLIQAESLDQALAGRGLAITKTILIKVPVDELVTRLSGRLVCRQCQTPYHRETTPPKTPDVCDSCGGELYQRQDDAPEAIRTRIQVYEDETQPLVEYYHRDNCLAEVDGVGEVDEICCRLLQALQVE
ncbi:MAG: adenylate kinase [Dehalococcoidia bacterium]|nr:adenylate kinase [Dehalococcoidia bacterium]